MSHVIMRQLRRCTALIFVGALADPFSLWASESCCNMVANPALKGHGRLVVMFPKEAEYRFSRIQIIPASGQPAITHYGAKALDLAPGQYEMLISGASVGQVTVAAGQETHLQAGALRIQADAKTRVEVWSRDRTRMLQFVMGHAVIGLPVGQYAVKIDKGTGLFSNLTIAAGEVRDFVPASAKEAGAVAVEGAGVSCAPAAKTAVYLAPEAKIRGVCSPASENAHEEPDAIPEGVPRQHAIRLPASTGLLTTRRLASTNDGKQMIQQAAQRLGGVQIHLALLAGHKYMINSCLGIKASAGTFDLVVPPPSITFGSTSVTISFGIGHIALEAFSIRLRPDVTDVIQPCHFSGRIAVGGEADNVIFSMTVDPLYSVETCDITSLNVSNAGWHLGSFRLDPIPPAVTGPAKDMVVDAMDHYSGFGLQDQFLNNLSELFSPNVVTTEACKALH